MVFYYAKGVLNLEKEIVTVSVRLTFYYYLCIAKCKLLALFSEGRATSYFDELTTDMNENSKKYIKVTKN